MFLRKWERRKARVFGGEEGLLCKSFHLFKILQEGRRKKARASSAKGFKVRTKPKNFFDDVWVGKTLNHP